jgi:hypothetical protein
MDTTRPWLRWGGRILSIVGIAYFTVELTSSRAPLQIRLQDWGPVGLGGLIYGSSLLLLALAWWHLLPRQRVDATHAASILLRTQIAKYLPGGIFHFVARQLQIVPLGVTNKEALRAQVEENLLLLVTVVSVGGVACTLPSGLLVPMNQIPKWVPLVGLGLAWMIIASLATRLRARTPIHYLAALAYMVLFALFLCGVPVAVWIFIHQDASGSLAASLVAAAGLSWAGGFLVPGAPGGIGVREAVTLYLLAPSLGTQQAATFALVFRVVTVVGDGTAFILGIALSKYPLRSR